ncbi:MAG TPA: hypothetical protein VD770_03035, partial [Coxiellaceae bacterium]|nr:hypothetical protein [Coxiellaceae bacterium]
MPESDYKAQQFLRGEFYVTLVLINNKLELVMKELNDFLEANSLSAAADEAQQTSATSRTSSEDGLPLSEIVALAATTTRILPEGVGTAVSGLATYPGMFVAAPSPKSVHSPTGPLSGVEETKESDKESDNVVVPTHS